MTSLKTLPKKKLKKHFKNMDSVMVALDPKKNGLE